MPNLSEQTLLAFHDELRKEADLAGLVARAAPRLRAAGSLAGVGAGVGALGGAGVGAVRRYREARDSGASGAATALQTLSGAGSGALRGAGIGAGAGAVAGGLTGAGAGLAQSAGMLGSSARFGQRQVHALTGMLQPHELEAIGGGAAGARSARSAVTAKAHEDAVARAMKPGGSFQAAREQLAPRVQRAERAVGLAEEVQRKGMTSLPGYLKAVGTHGVVPTLRLSAREQLANMSPAMGALAVGLPALGAASALVGKEAPDGPGKGERLGESLGGLVGGFAGSAMPIVGNLAAGAGGAGAGKMLGRGVDRLRGRRPVTPMLGQRLSTHEPTNEGQHMPVERAMSPAAAGQQQMQESA